MQRDILFRAKKVYDNTWIEGFYFFNNNEHGIIENKAFIGSWSLIIPETVGQFTGLFDKNGVKIFEGDIVELYNPYNMLKAKGTAIIDFSYEYAGGWIATSDVNNKLNIGTRTHLIEVIGNIHNNTELL